jgi:hypothetical protein
MLLELSHVCGIAAIAHHPHHQVWYAYLGKYGKTRNSCLLSVKKNEMGVAT